MRPVSVCLRCLEIKIPCLAWDFYFTDGLCVLRRVRDAVARHVQVLAELPVRWALLSWVRVEQMAYAVVHGADYGKRVVQAV